MSRVRCSGAKGQLTLRADSGLYNHALVQVCRRTGVRCAITVRQRQSRRDLIDAIPEGDWTPIPYWMEDFADVAETTYTPFQSEPDATPVRLTVRRVKPTPGSQLALFHTYSYHGFITDRECDTLELGANRHDNRVAFQQHPPGLYLESRRDSAVGVRRMITRLSAHGLCYQTDTSGNFYNGSSLPASRSRWRRC